MNKTNEELAVEVAVAYINAAANQKKSTGENKSMPSGEYICKIITRTYNTLEKLTNCPEKE